MKEAVLERPKTKVWTYEDYLAGRIPPEVSEVIDGRRLERCLRETCTDGWKIFWHSQ